MDLFGYICELDGGLAQNWSHAYLLVRAQPINCIGALENESHFQG